MCSEKVELTQSEMSDDDRSLAELVSGIVDGEIVSFMSVLEDILWSVLDAAKVVEVMYKGEDE